MSKSDTAEQSRWRRLSPLAMLALLSLFGLAISACTDDGGADSGIVADSDSDSNGSDDAGDPDSNETTGGTGATGTTGSTNSTNSTGSGGDSGQDDSNNAGQAIPELCSVEEVNRQPFYAVDNIPADDPDGGLNLRTSFEGGDVIETLTVGTVVAAQDCYRAGDGGVWYAVSTETAAGWVNAAFLGEDISPLIPTFGGTDTEAAVVALLDALAAREWAEAAELLTVGDPGIVPAYAQLAVEDSTDLAGALEAYCGTRVCDAPFTVTDVRGSYQPDLVSPEVDVEFVYSGGMVTETFGRIDIEDEFAIAQVPGRSILSLSSSLRSTADLVEQPNPDDSDLYEAAEQIRLALLSEQGPRIPDDNLVDEGVAVSLYAYIDPEPTRRELITKADLDSGLEAVRIWGYQDGTGWPIVDSVEGFMADYRRSAALLGTDVVGIDRRVGLGNTIDNLAEVFPEARIVEFHREGRGEAASFNWSSVRMALELRSGEWQLVGLVGDSWTI